MERERRRREKEINWERGRRATERNKEKESNREWRSKKKLKTEITLASFPVQSFQSSASSYPLSEPLPKIEAHSQATGELKYTCDFASAANQVRERRQGESIG